LLASNRLDACTVRRLMEARRQRPGEHEIRQGRIGFRRIVGPQHPLSVGFLETPSRELQPEFFQAVFRKGAHSIDRASPWVKDQARTLSLVAEYLLANTPSQAMRKG